MKNKDEVFTKVNKSPGKYPAEIKSEAIDMFMRTRPEYKSRVDCAKNIATLLGIGCYDTVLVWVKQAEIDRGLKSGATSKEIEENRKLRREIAELKRANGILRAASSFFAAELDRPLKI
jgi:transposase